MPLVAPVNKDELPKLSENSDTPMSTGDLATAVRDTFINRTAIAPETYPDVFGTLLQYTEGVPVIVEYFKRRGPYINNQSIDVSFSLERASVHLDLDLIHNFEIRIKGQLEIKIDTGTTETTIDGIGIVYPGFKPNVGDLFYFKLPDNRIGVFTVNLTEPLSIFRGSYYQINFHLIAFLNTEIDTKIRGAVSEELYFDKQFYFSDETTLLKSTSYNQLIDLVKYRKAIISRLMNKFYHVSEKTIIRPNNIFDTYLVEYLLNKISLKDNSRDLCQIPDPYIGNFENSIWSTFISQDVSQLIFTGYTLHQYQQFLFDVGTSNIDNYSIISFIDPDNRFDIERLRPIKFDKNDTKFRHVSYIFSDRFYYALLLSFERFDPITDVVPFLSDMVDDERIFENLNTTFYSFGDDKYHDISFFNTHNKLTGSNNDVHLPEIEFLVYDYIVNNNIDVKYLMEKIIPKFPFNTMTPYDQLYTLAILLNIIDATIPRIR